MMPKRIQRMRSKGWKMPPDAVYVGRPTIFGNPWTMAGVRAWLKSVNVTETYSDRDRAENLVMNYRLWVEGGLPVTMNGRLSEIRRRLSELRGKDLACWCKPDMPCHADVLLELANRPAP